MHAKTSSIWVVRGLASCLVASIPLIEVVGAGIPEPDLVMYGVIKHVGGGSDVRLISGTLTWEFQPTGGGTPIRISTKLQNINDQFSYVLRVPCETIIDGLTASPDTLKLSATPTIYDRSKVTVNDETAILVQPELAKLTLTGTDRGLLQRVDLNLGSVGPDFATWAIQHFGTANVDQNADADGDGMSNLAEFSAGTDPKDVASLFKFINVERDPAGGVLLQWSSAANKLYTIQRSNDLLSGFVDLKTGEPATPPVNSYRDTTATVTGPYFYRIRLQ